MFFVSDAERKQSNSNGRGDKHKIVSTKKVFKNHKQYFILYIN